MDIKKAGLLSSLILFGAALHLAQPQGQAPVPAGSGAAKTTTKIGFIDFYGSVAETEEGKREVVEVEGFIQSKQKELEAKRNDLEKLRNQFQTQQLTLSDDAKAEMQRQIEEMNTHLQRASEDAQREVDRRKQAIIQKVGTKMSQIISGFARESGFDAILVMQPQQLAYVDPAVDVTNEIIVLYNKAYPVAASPAAQQKPAANPTPPPAAPPKKP
ncbi:MAG: OmpH family outer membrane protein [Acidobacteria bacterium]|nr:OmpH family outer membrane protein [Acidobacteriota bacterium]